jgi:hypothetical protein
MSGRVWISSVKSNAQIGNKQGLRTKFFGEEWEPASFSLPIRNEKNRENMNRSARGYVLKREELPEAAAIWNEKSFKKTHEIFWAGGFIVVKSRLAEILSRFDLGDGGLVPFPIYKADLVTPMDGEFFLPNFGARKASILLEDSEDVRKFYVDKHTGLQIWDVNYLKEDAEVVMSPAALEGADLWYEEMIYNKIFMSDALASALQEAGLAEDWCLRPCRIVETQLLRRLAA